MWQNYALLILFISKKNDSQSLLEIVFLFFKIELLLSFNNCFRRTSRHTRTAICAHICINNINISFRDSFNRTFAWTSTTSNTIFCNYVSHFYYNFKINKKQRYGILFFVENKIVFFFIFLYLCR